MRLPLRPILRLRWQGSVEQLLAEQEDRSQALRWVGPLAPSFQGQARRFGALIGAIAGGIGGGAGGHYLGTAVYQSVNGFVALR